MVSPSSHLISWWPYCLLQGFHQTQLLYLLYGYRVWHNLCTCSARALPLSYRKLMTDKLSPLLDLYPTGIHLLAMFIFFILVIKSHLIRIFFGRVWAWYEWKTIFLAGSVCLVFICTFILSIWQQCLFLKKLMKFSNAFSDVQCEYDQCVELVVPHIMLSSYETLFDNLVSQSMWTHDLGTVEW